MVGYDKNYVWFWWIPRPVFLVNIQELKDETGRLYKLLSERDMELRMLRKKQEQHKNIINSSGQSSSTFNAGNINFMQMCSNIMQITVLFYLIHRDFIAGWIIIQVII